MSRFMHGGDTWVVARELGIAPDEVLDFSASINPLGMPPEVSAAAHAAIDRAVYYPETDAASFLEELSVWHKLPQKHLVAGNGSTELIHILPQALKPHRALLVVPAFSEYVRSLEQAGVDYDLFHLLPDEGFDFYPGRLVEALKPGTDMVLLANPGNPTGVGIEPEKIERLATALSGRALVVVDEAFVDFAPQLSVLDAVSRHDNLYVLRSLTKFYAIPGLRVGYLAGPEAGTRRVADFSPPWSLSTVAVAAGRACLQAEEYRQETFSTVPVLRRELAEGLIALEIAPVASCANYLLARLSEGQPSASELAAALRRQGILVRDCLNFPPLNARYLRLAVRRREENRRLLDVMTRLLPES